MPSRLPVACARALALVALLSALAGCAELWWPTRRHGAHEEAGSRVDEVPVSRATRDLAPHDLVRPPAPPSSAGSVASGTHDRSPRASRGSDQPAAATGVGEERYEPLAPKSTRKSTPVKGASRPTPPVKGSPVAAFFASGGGGAASSGGVSTSGHDAATAQDETSEQVGDDGHAHASAGRDGADGDEDLGPDEVEVPLAPPDSPPPRGSGPELASRRDNFYGPRINAAGIAAPYPPELIFRGFGRCIRGVRHHHEGIDLGGVGPLWGLGTPIRSMARAEVVFIGRGDQNPELFGTPDLRRGSVTRGRWVLPRRGFVEGYGEVAFFTRRKGRWRSGNIIVTRGLEGPLKGHIIRYMHMGAIHPDLRPGATVEVGQELALMGGTGVQESAPHLHLDIEAPDGHRVDVAPLVGEPPTATCEGVPTGLGDAELTASAIEKINKYRRAPARGAPVSRVAFGAARAGHAAGQGRRGLARDDAGEEDEEDEEDGEPGDDVGRVHIRRAEYACTKNAYAEDFSSGRYDAHAFVVKLRRGEVLHARLEGVRGGWRGRLGASGRGVSVKTSRGITTVSASLDTEVMLKIEGARGVRPPRAAVYRLALKGKCRGKSASKPRPGSDEPAARAQRGRRGAPSVTTSPRKSLLNAGRVKRPGEAGGVGQSSKAKQHNRQRPPRDGADVQGRGAAGRKSVNGRGSTRPRGGR